MPSATRIVRAFGLVLLAAVFVHPWILYGLQGPGSDSTTYMQIAAGTFGLVDLTWRQLLNTEGIVVLLAPLLFVIRSPLFFWIGSGLVAASGLFLLYGIFRLLERHLGTALGFLGGFLIAGHPFLQQLHYFWMKEFYYVASAILALHSLALFWKERKFRDYLAAVLFCTFATLMRSQGALLFVIGLLPLLWQLAIDIRDRAQWRRVAGLLLLWIATPTILFFPLRALNYHRFGMFRLNYNLSSNLPYYLSEEGKFSPGNGPYSRWFFQKALEISPLAISGVRLDPPDQVDAAKRIVGGDYDYKDFRNLCYEIFHNIPQMQECTVKLVKEGIAHDLPHYMNWIFSRFKWYLFADVENREGFFSDFILPGYLEAFPRGLTLRDQTINDLTLGGVVWKNPALSDHYANYRATFDKLFTKTKRILVKFSPIVFIFGVFVLPFEVSLFFGLCAIFHLISILALSAIVGFHFRYSAPFDVLVTLYLVMDLFVLKTLIESFIGSFRTNENVPA